MELIDGLEFYNLMQKYRTAPMADQEMVSRTFEAVKDFIRRKYTSNASLEQSDQWKEDFGGEDDSQ